MREPVNYGSLIEADLNVIFCFLSRTGSDQNPLVTRRGSDVPEPAYSGRGPPWNRTWTWFWSSSSVRSGSTRRLQGNAWFPPIDSATVVFAATWWLKVQLQQQRKNPETPTPPAAERHLGGSSCSVSLMKHSGFYFL